MPASVRKRNTVGTYDVAYLCTVNKALLVGHGSDGCFMAMICTGAPPEKGIYYYYIDIRY